MTVSGLPPHLGRIRSIARLVHSIVIFWAAVLLGATAAMTGTFEVGVWVTCTGPDAINVTATHPYFCEYHLDGDKKDNANDGRSSCGNEAFTFSSHTVTHMHASHSSAGGTELKLQETSIGWAELLALGDARAFPDAGANLRGNSTLFTKTDSGMRWVRVASSIAVVGGSLSLVAALVMARATFYGLSHANPRSDPRGRILLVEPPRRWLKLGAVFVIALAAAVSYIVAVAMLEIVRLGEVSLEHGGSGGGSGSGGGGHASLTQTVTRRHQMAAVAWSKYYEPAYGCIARPQAFDALSVVAMQAAGWVILIILLRTCCAGCRPRDVAADQIEWQAPRRAVCQAGHCAPLLGSSAPAPPPPLYGTVAAAASATPNRVSISIQDRN